MAYDQVFEQNKANISAINAGLAQSGETIDTPEDYKRAGITFSGDQVGILNTQNAADNVAKADETLNNLTEKIPQGFIKLPGGYLQNQATGEMINPKDVKDTSTEDLAKVFETPEGKAMAVAQGEADTYRQDLDSLKSQIDSFKITDEQLNSQISSISSRWDARINEMRDVNARREKAFETLGFRTGAQFSGGVKGGVFGGVISEEERLGVLRIGELEAQKSSEISAAKSAAQQQNWNVYVQKVNSAQDTYDKQLAEVKRLNDLYIEKQKATEEEKKAADKITRQVGIDSVVSGLFSQGMTASQILDELNTNEAYAGLGGVQLDEISNSIEFFDKMKPEEIDPLKGASGDIKDFHLFFPNVDIGTPEGYQQYLRYKAQVAASGRAPTEKKDFFNFDSSAKSRLLGVGLSQSEIEAIQTNLNNGVSMDDIIKASTDLSPEEIKGLQNVMSGVTPSQAQDQKEYITEDYLKNNYDLSKMAEDKGFTHWYTPRGTEVTNLTTNLMEQVKKYRDQGFTDKEIEDLLF